MAEVLIEVCVDDADGLAEAVAGGAGRIELCSALALGGLTPSSGLMRAAASCGLPVYAMIRPRAGDFVFSTAEIAIMQADIDAARAAGLAGVVLGASQPDGRLDRDVLARLVARATGLGLTLHRSFDLVPDLADAINLAVDLGFERILTSGQALSAPLGASVLARIFDLAAGRIGILPGAGISAETVHHLRHLPLTEVHSSCSEPVIATGRVLDLGFAHPAQRRTSAARVRALRTALAH
jgi:copper homeostasis protein